MDDLMTLDEVAKYLRVTKKTIYRLLERRRIPATKVGHQWRFVKATIDDWLRQASVNTGTGILVVDDDETVCSLFKDTLEEQGYTITTANEAAKGLELAKTQDYGLVFLDLKIPGMDGAELFRQIRLAKPALPVTIITGYPDDGLMEAALAHGPLGVMNKPFRTSDIIAAANNYFHLDRQLK